MTCNEYIGKTDNDNINIKTKLANNNALFNYFVTSSELKLLKDEITLSQIQNNNADEFETKYTTYTSLINPANGTQVYPSTNPNEEPIISQINGINIKESDRVVRHVLKNQNNAIIYVIHRDEPVAEEKQTNQSQNSKLLLDTSFILDNSLEDLKDFSNNNDIYITDIVLQELDGKKNAEGEVGYRAREFFRQMNEATFSKESLINSVQPQRNDGVQKYIFKSGLTLHVVVRKNYKTRDINDSKIIEVAKDYNLQLTTIDTAQKVRARNEDCEVYAQANLSTVSITAQAIQVAKDYEMEVWIENDNKLVETLRSKGVQVFDGT